MTASSNTPFPFDLVGFDLDGTLLDTSDELTEAVNYTLGRLGRPAFSRDEVKPMIGLGAKHMLKVGLEASGETSDELLYEWLPVLLEFYGDNLGSGSHPYPGLLPAMDRLDAMGVKMAVVTNKYERFAVKLLEAVGLAPRFGCIIGGDTMGKGFSKPHRAPIDEMMKRCAAERGAFIGDSIYDIGAGKNAGIPTVAVSFGFLHQPVEELGADAIIDHYDELIPALTRLG
ncbi:HAD-IA family hydrolase [Parasphingopyxis marina]|uniref:phosphoglycolate phosphatase n=1 Tax=Parasphingopyxis marina TaxID=2761622 RepID=A0A842HTR2_9SPHN|nr:HAD-IA family hydrolase [Parasphingopyxis marina]MBC2777318.1 HAD-IA family hydrolase [Parasphingopyxis marina]